MTGPHGAAAERRRVFEQHHRILAEQSQRVIDAELRRTRRELLAEVRRRGGPLAVPLFDDYFLSIADRPAVIRAIIDATTVLSSANSCDLQLVRHGELCMVGHRGFSDEFLSFFATVRPSQSTPCSTALTTRRPVLVDDVVRTNVFSDRESRDVCLEAGSRTIQSFPLLHADGQVLGVLSFHYDKFSESKVSSSLIAAGASRALARV